MSMKTGDMEQTLVMGGCRIKKIKKLNANKCHGEKADAGAAATNTVLLALKECNNQFYP